MVYQDIVVLAGFIFVYSLIAARVEKTAMSGPVLAVVFGFLTGHFFLGLLDVKINDEGYRILAELALALVLFSDAASTNLRVLTNNIAIPTRLLLIGLPLTILLGAFAGLLIFQGFSWIELGILATMLAPTDAALGKAVVTNPRVPSRIREALNVESGLNDGISVPVLFLFIAMFTADFSGSVSFAYGLSLFAREIGIGLAVGLSVAWLGDWFIHFSAKRNWISLSWKPVVIIALAFLCFALAQLIGGSGFIACFSGGLIYGYVNKKHKIELLTAAEGIGDTLSLTTWGIFGAVILPKYFPLFTWEILLYGVLSLTFIRMIPVFLSLINSGFSFKEKLFMGWFGPRGLASIVFGIMVLEVHLPHLSIISTTVVCTILLSIVAHGISAIPFIKILNKPEKLPSPKL